MSQTVFEAARKVKAFLKEKYATTTTVHSAGAVAICDNDILSYKDVKSALRSAEDSGYVFSYKFNHGNIEITPEN